MKRANDVYIKNEFNEFCFTLQSIWNNCYDIDRKYINEEVERKEALDTELGYTSHDYPSVPIVLTLDRFHEMMETNIGEPDRITTRDGILCQWRHGSEWRRAYQIVQESLRKKYQGDIKKYEKDRFKEASK